MPLYNNYIIVKNDSFTKRQYGRKTNFAAPDNFKISNNQQKCFSTFKFQKKSRNEYPMPMSIVTRRYSETNVKTNRSVL